MIISMEHLHSNEAAIEALREVAREYNREIEVSHDIGADQTSRRSAAGVGVTTDPDGSLPHEALVEFGGSPRLMVRLFPEDDGDADALITVEDVECHDIQRDQVPAFVRSVFGGLAHVKAKRFPPGYRLVVPLPGDKTFKEYIPMVLLTPWLSSQVR
ncbi:hypothetical protein DCW30_11340 [Streptomyces alfalfae]|uniref:Uncharacterized protein n=1 Tax=Streptomyces alfalfae TaxID=1642299 RepID=A0ABN4VIF3_9ACTN|nr:hypothetical protein A7J05_18210 [Streptomyces alfalfae]AYA17819.1 hypothetical protein D3X13_17590 [Streptomyces fradiae]RXX45030.1 hypothetical protein DCW30_11340 [Streptomyces alfalfae]RZN02936.1 hypothetical protein D4104_05660 [Streptomyces alfalfae]